VAEIAQIRQRHDDPIEKHKMSRIVDAVVDVIEHPSDRRGREGETWLVGYYSYVQGFPLKA
jgi:hypothetical protein